MTLTPRAIGYYAKSSVELLRFVRPRRHIFGLLLGSRSGPTRRVSIPSLDVRFDVRPGMDLWSVKETFLDRFYERYGFVLAPGWVVVDIGAAIGEFTVWAAAVPGTRVIACEPFPGSVDLLIRNIHLAAADNVEIVAKAVAGHRGELRLEVAGGEPLSFTSSEARPDAVTAQGAVIVEAVTLADLIDLADARRIDLLKLDCEGAEYDILMNAAAGALSRVDRIVMEYHDVVTEYTHADLVDFLEGQGFDVQVVPNVVHPDEIGYLRAERRMAG